MTTPPRRRYRAPQEDGAALIDPPLSEATRLIEYNRRVLSDFDQVVGTSDLRRIARACLLESTVFFEKGKAFTNDAGQPLILSGHQPELYHPGVWLKNYVISAIAKTVGGAAVNLMIDNDVVHSASIRVPAGIPQTPRVIEVPFDESLAGIPWEEVAVSDRQLIRSFSQRAKQSLIPFLADSRQSLMLDRFWPHVEAAVESRIRRMQEVAEKSNVPPPPGVPPDMLQRLLERLIKLGECLTQGRHDLEREVGLVTKEAGLSQLCWMPFFFDFVSLFFSRHQEFHRLYNDALNDYRRENHVRSHSHPVPDLARDGNWFEMPFWIWSDKEPLRRRAFVQRVGNAWELSDGKDIRLSQADCTWTKEVPFIFGGARGIKLRPRALITTMYARLVLSDLFIHGIGGAKYDEVTDEIIRRFFGIEPPKYITATATFRLPIERPYVTAEDLRNSARRLRDVRHRPEALCSHPLVRSGSAIHQQLDALAAEKREYLARHNPRRNAPMVFAALDRINREMHALLQPVEAELKAAHARLIDDARKSALLGSREFSFVLFSEELPARLLALCQGVA